MMLPEYDHAKAVAALLDSCDNEDDAERLVNLFCQAFNSIWNRALRTLGDVTLTAIGDRTLHFAAERHPYLESCRLELDGIHCVDLPAKTKGVPMPEMKTAIAYALTEFLTVLGTLTAEILTPALHAELAALAPSNQDSLFKKEGTL